MHWWLPLKGSTFAGEIDGLFLAILIITGIAFVIVEAGLLWFVVKYRGRPGRQAYYTHGSTRAEVIWRAIPAVTMVALGLISNHYWVKSKGRNSVPPNAYPRALPGTYELGCAELCGLGHYRMRAQVFVHTQEEFDAWMKQAAKGGATS